MKNFFLIVLPKESWLAFVGFFSATLIFLGVGYSGYRSVGEIKDATSRRAMARQALLELEQFFSLLKDAETSQRGYLLTGRKKYSKVYEKAVEELPASIAQAKAILNDDPAQAERAVKIEALAKLKLEELKSTMAIRDKRGLQAAISVVNTDKGKAIMDELRDAMKEVEVSALETIQERSKAMETIAARSASIVVWGNVVAFSFFCGAFFLSWVNRSKRRKAEDDRKRAHDMLRRQAKDLAEVVRTQHAVATAPLEPKAVMQAFIANIISIVGAEGAVIEIVEGDELVYTAVSPGAEKHLGLRIKLEGSLSGLCVRTNTQQICADSQTDTRVNREACRNAGVRSMVVSPLLHGRSGFKGVLKVWSSSPNVFTSEHSTRLELMTALLSSALGQSKEFSEKQVIISALLETEDRLMKAAAAADQATRAKSEFLANMSHEIRTPLNGILGMTGMLIDSGLNADQLEQAEVLQRSGESLLALLNDILDFSKIEAGMLSLEEFDFDLTSTLQDVQKSFAVTAKKKGLTVTLEVDKNIPPYLKGDPARLRQILVNLVSNGLKFTEQGSVGIHAYLVESREKSATLRLEVTDTGIGIPESVQRSLFTPFTQADASTTRKYGGTGLGLSISKRIAEKMGGEIGVRSKPGEGSTFWCTVRMGIGNQVQTGHSDRGAQVIPSAGKYRVLLAEDNQVNQAIAKKMVEKLGFRVDVVANGLEVLSALRERPYDFVLMDCQMPEMDGYEATAEIRKSASSAFQRVPVIAMTANAMSGDRERCLNAGMDDYISKPLNAKAMNALLAKWVEQKEKWKAAG